MFSQYASCKWLICYCLLLLSARSYSQCAVLDSLNSAPAAVNGEYAAGTTVTFNYALDGWIEYGGNYVHGFLINLGQGWDASSLTIISLPNSCDAKGAWEYFNTDTSASPPYKVFGKGIYYQYYTNNRSPGHNYGDHTVTGTCVWKFSFSVKTKSICGGDSLTASVTATGDGTTGEWGNISCSGDTVHAPSAVCKPDCNNKHLQATVTANTTICSGLALQLNAEGGTGYSWTPVTDVSCVTCSNPFASPLATTTFHVHIFSDTCSADDSVIVTVLLSPVAVFTSRDSGFKVIFDTTGTIGAAMYSWSYGDGTSDTGKPLFHTYKSANTYHVCYTVTNMEGCTDDTCRDIIVDTASLSPLYAPGLSLSFFPNPCTNYLNITLPAPAKVTVTNLLGQEMYKGVERSEYRVVRQIDVTAFPAGIYFLRVQSGNEVKAAKFVKE